MKDVTGGGTQRNAMTIDAVTSTHARIAAVANRAATLTNDNLRDFADLARA
ncbi:MAG TPA: hypothetical protein VJA26_07525 [Gammaproteobacteria bacterium]|nr:hypothetical protein [Gammaproteobacteria bacterium]